MRFCSWLFVTSLVLLIASVAHCSKAAAYPNPVTDVLNVSYNNEISSIDMFNLLGQHIQTIRPNATDAKIDMSGLPQGTYLLQVSSQGNSTMIKVVKNQ